MGAQFDRLVDIMAKLRAPGGCPWDRAQSRRDLKPYLLEETYEVLDAIERDDTADMCEELGDLLLQVVFHAQIGREENRFDIEAVCRSINEKLIRRHPHVFGEEKADTPEKVLENWESIKKREKNGKSALGGVPKALPALLKAYRLQQKAARVGFDWEESGPVLDKVEEEWSEFKAAVGTRKPEEIREELGDFLFSVVNLSRFLGLDPEDTLQQANAKFAGRFREMEEEARTRGVDIHSLDLEGLDELWQRVKSREGAESGGP